MPKKQNPYRGTCKDCKYFMTQKCWEQIQTGRNPEPQDNCAGGKYKKGIIGGIGNDR